MAGSIQNLLGAGQGIPGASNAGEPAGLNGAAAPSGGQGSLLNRGAELAGAGVFKPNGNAASMVQRGYGSEKSALDGLMANQMFTAKDAQNLLMPVQQRMPVAGPQQTYNPKTIQYVRSLLGV